MKDNEFNREKPATEVIPAGLPNLLTETDVN